MAIPSPPAPRVVTVDTKLRAYYDNLTRKKVFKVKKSSDQTYFQSQQ